MKCIRCGENNRNTRGDCKTCNRARSKVWRESPEGRAYMATLRAPRKAYAKYYYHRNKETFKKWRLLRTHQITWDAYLEILLQQHNLCKICKIELKADHFRAASAPVVDHCHVSGRVRGILCQNCNKLLGHLEALLEKIKWQDILDYLTEPYQSATLK